MAKQRRVFNPKTFLSTVGVGREMMSFRKGQIIFAQGDASGAVFVIQSGNVRLSAKTKGGKGITFAILRDEDFVGEESIAGETIRTASANALTDCLLLRIASQAMLRGLAREVTLLKLFCFYVLARNIRYQEDLLDQRSNFSEKRLARFLLRHSHFDGQSSPEVTMMKINHEILAEMVGTTRSRVCFFMKRFKDAGYIDYSLRNPQLRVRRSLLAFYSR